MQKISFASLPFVARFGVAAALFFLWTLLERGIIEPLGIYHYMPLYRVEGPCIWDGIAAVVILTWLWFASRRPRGGATSPR